MTGSADPARTMRALLDEVIREATGLSVDLDASFFDAGLTSATLIRVHDRLRARTGRAIPVTALFRYPNRRALADHLVATPAPADPGAGAPSPAGAAGLADPQARRDLRERIRRRNGGPTR